MASPSTPLVGEHDSLLSALENLVSHTARSNDEHDKLGTDAAHGPYTPAHVSRSQHAPWWSSLAVAEGISEQRLDDLFASHHLGNYVAIRGSDQRIFESMPIAVRIGMHLLFFKSKKTSLLRWDSVEDALKTLSIRQGRIYDDASDPEAVQEHIRSFIKTYDIDTSELLEPHPDRYPTMNSFFYRKLRPGARPIADASNPRLVSSVADCRLTVFDSVDSATKLWVKGKDFSLTHLLGDSSVADAKFPPGSSVAIFRLAPADYHRYHHPVGPAVCGPTRHMDGEYYTVNPQAVNADFDVFTANRRDVLLLDWQPAANERHSIAFVAIGAMMVGAIGWTKAAQGDEVKRGDEAGFFAYGGSTVIVVFPPSSNVTWDADLLDNSKSGIETMVRVGDRIGISQVPSSSS